MATFDVSRADFDPDKHYQSVRMQMGRVLTDYDFNENERMEEENGRRTLGNVIGPFSSPDEGFRIGNLVFPDGYIDFDILAGVLYLGGLRLQLEAKEMYRLQKDWLQQVPLSAGFPLPPTGTAPPPSQERFDLAYLEAWQQPVCAVEDSALLEPALGGPDTTTRVRNMRRVKVHPNIGAQDCASAWQRLKKIWADERLGVVNEEHERIRNVRLTVSFTGDGSAEDLCSPSAAGGYLGAENQTIRVQLTRKGYLTWGFDNASPYYRAIVNTQGIVTLLTLPKDEYHWPVKEGVAEFLPWSAVLSNGEKIAEQSGYLTKVKDAYDPEEHTFAVDPLPPDFGQVWKNRADSQELGAGGEFLFVRFWTRGDDLSSDAEIAFTPGEPVALGHTGLQVTIEGEEQLTEDYWVFSVRPETPDLIIPKEIKQGLPPLGVRRFFAPLAIIHWTFTHGKLEGKVIHDCRKTFVPLTELDRCCCCTLTVGDGVVSKGDVQSIQEAVDKLPEAGGKICVLPGRHRANVKIRNRRNIRITGCGEHTVIVSGDKPENPLLHIAHSQGIHMSQLTLDARQGTGIALNDDSDPKVNPPSRQITILENRITAFQNGIRIVKMNAPAGDSQIRIAFNQIGMVDRDGGGVAVFSLADGVRMERNRIHTVPPSYLTFPDGSANIPSLPDFNEPSLNPISNPASNLPPGGVMPATDTNPASAFAASSHHVFKTRGGIQIGCTSEGVAIMDNEIIGGRGHGIVLGDVDVWTLPPPPGDDVYPSPPCFIYDISIWNNHISDMGLSGIGSAAFSNLDYALRLMTVVGPSVIGNTITRCARQIPAEIPQELLYEIAYGGITLSGCEDGVIRENRIEDNGTTAQKPCCGIFIRRGFRNEIIGNRISGNGRLSSTTSMLPGQRGGIIVKMSLAETQPMKEENYEYPLTVHDLLVHGNTVHQPIGQALSVMAYGSVSVEGNRFSSQGVDRNDPLSSSGAVVWIKSLGISTMLTGPTKYKELAKSVGLDFESIFTKLFGFLSAPRVKGAILYSNNQSVLDLRSKDKVNVLCALGISSKDDIRFTRNQCDCLAASTYNENNKDKVQYQAYMAGFSICASDNSFFEKNTKTVFSLGAYGQIVTVLGNQSTRCLQITGQKILPPELIQQSNLTLNNCSHNITKL
ncbi:MAG: hypothetical protein KIPDCIKN_00463 [Haliscomenobacter sp.]|nr:hypothetical protein [Haliscomenobacter sp.]